MAYFGGITTVGIFGNETAERTLLALQNYGEGYAREIADLYGLPHSVVQKQLLRLERDGVLVGSTSVNGRAAPASRFSDDRRMWKAAPTLIKSHFGTMVPTCV
ncbi:hypothetical protein [Hydrocarboniphaga sp.]|uniref:hypothetical protein n=1 Tax=Hydrocarboniphaga sp. TaxID=2033016 RepID=UPI003D0FD766